MLYPVLSHRDARCAMDPPAAIFGTTLELTGNAISAPDPIISRRPDGSINYDHYDRIARDLRAHDQRAALMILLAPAQWLRAALRPRSRTGWH